MREEGPNARSDTAAVAAPEHPLGLHRIVSAEAPRVAPEQAPCGEYEAPPHAIRADRLHRVARARGLVLTAPRKRWGDEPLVDDDRGGRGRAGGQRGPPLQGMLLTRGRVRTHCARSTGMPSSAACSPPPMSGGWGDPRRFTFRISSLRDASIPASPRCSASSLASGRATTTPHCA